MFEIPDDDDKFWENLPLGDNLHNGNRSEATVSYETSASASVGGGESPISQDLVSNSPVVPFHGQDQSHQGSKSVGTCIQPGPSLRLSAVQNASIDTTVPKHIFNLTQSSSESDLELSLTCDNEHNKSMNIEQSNQSLHGIGNLRDERYVAQHTLSVRDQRNIDQSGDKVHRKSSGCRNGRLHQKVHTNAGKSVTSHCNNIQMSMPPESTLLDLNFDVGNGREKPSDKSFKKKRKFPGPAGLLPQLVSGHSMEFCQEVQVDSPKAAKKEDVPVPPSQTTEDVFRDAPWQMLQQDLGEECPVVLRNYSIATTLTKAKQKQLPNGKVPLLFVVVDTIDIQGTDGCVVLRDKTGKMQGTAHRELLKESEFQLQQGVVLVLKQVGVISPSPRTHYLNLTPNNVVRVYRSNGDGTGRVTHAEDENLLQLVSSVEKQARQSQIAPTPRVGQLLSLPGTPNPSLFQNVHSSPRVSQLTPRHSSSFSSPLTSPGVSPGQLFRVPQASPSTSREHSGTPYQNIIPLRASSQRGPPAQVWAQPSSSVNTTAYKQMSHCQSTSARNLLLSSPGQSHNNRSLPVDTGANTVARSLLQTMATDNASTCISTPEKAGNTSTPSQQKKWSFKPKSSARVSTPLRGSASSTLSADSPLPGCAEVTDNVLRSDSSWKTASHKSNNITTKSFPINHPQPTPYEEQSFNIPIGQSECTSESSTSNDQNFVFSPRLFIETAKCDSSLVLNTSAMDRNPHEIDMNFMWHDDRSLPVDTGANTVARSLLQTMATDNTSTCISTPEKAGNTSTPSQQKKWSFKPKSSARVSTPLRGSASSTLSGDSPLPGCAEVTDNVLRSDSSWKTASHKSNNITTKSFPIYHPQPTPYEEQSFNIPIGQSECTSESSTSNDQNFVFSPRPFIETVTDRNPNEMDVNFMWHDDLTDEFLTELTEDNFP